MRMDEDIECGRPAVSEAASGGNILDNQAAMNQNLPTQDHRPLDIHNHATVIRTQVSSNNIKSGRSTHVAKSKKSSKLNVVDSRSTSR